MNTVIDVVVIVVIIILIGLFMAVKIVKQYEQGVLFRLGRVLGARQPGLRVNALRCIYSTTGQCSDQRSAAVSSPSTPNR